MAEAIGQTPKVKRTGAADTQIRIALRQRPVRNYGSIECTRTQVTFEAGSRTPPVYNVPLVLDYRAKNKDVLEFFEPTIYEFLYGKESATVIGFGSRSAGTSWSLGTCPNSHGALVGVFNELVQQGKKFTMHANFHPFRKVPAASIETRSQLKSWLILLDNVRDNAHLQITFSRPGQDLHFIDLSAKNKYKSLNAFIKNVPRLAALGCISEDASLRDNEETVKKLLSIAKTGSLPNTQLPKFTLLPFLDEARLTRAPHPTPILRQSTPVPASTALVNKQCSDDDEAYFEDLRPIRKFTLPNKARLAISPQSTSILQSTSKATAGARDEQSFEDVRYFEDLRHKRKNPSDKIGSGRR